jgi:MFS family permease
MTVRADGESARRVVTTYLVTSVLFTLATSIIWGVNTLFLLASGLDIFQVFVVNAAFMVGQLVFEVPTGVVADTIGRRTSFLLGIFALFLSTLWYVGASMYQWGVWSFVGASVVLGFGFTCQTGAVDAWLMDALDHVAYEVPRERVFAWGGMSTGVAMLFGTVAGGILGQFDLAWPYLARSVLLLAAFGATAVLMHDMGFEPRPLRARTFAEETRKIARVGVRFGWRNEVIRPLFYASFAGGLFWMYAFYAWQRYALDLLGRELVWVSGVLVAGFAAAGIVGNVLVKPVMRDGARRRDPGKVLAVLAGISALFTAGMALVGLVDLASGPLPLALASALWLLVGVVFGLTGPVRQAYLNEHIPSAQRATVLSLDSFFADGGGALGQPALGWLARQVSIPLTYLVGSFAIAAGVPLYAASSRAAARARASVPAPVEGDSHGGPVSHQSSAK